MKTIDSDTLKSTVTRYFNSYKKYSEEKLVRELISYRIKYEALREEIEDLGSITQGISINTTLDEVMVYNKYDELFLYDNSLLGAIKAWWRDKFGPKVSDYVRKADLDSLYPKQEKVEKQTSIKEIVTNEDENSNLLLVKVMNFLKKK